MESSASGLLALGVSRPRTDGCLAHGHFGGLRAIVFGLGLRWPHIASASRLLIFFQKKKKRILTKSIRLGKNKINFGFK